MSMVANPIENPVGASKNGNGRPTIEMETVAVRFAGDSGDGMQLAGTQFTNASAIFGNASAFADRPPVDP